MKDKGKKVDFMLCKDCKGLMNGSNDLGDLQGWCAEEKYDGYRARFQGNDEKVFISRQNKVYKGAPEWFKNAMPPNINMDGELWIGYGKFQSMGITRRVSPHYTEWIPVKYIVFDLPDLDEPFEKRKKELKKIVKNNQVRWNIIRKDLPEPLNTLECPVIYSPYTKVNSMDHLKEFYDAILKKGGEGIILRNPKGYYTDGRSNDIVKCKPDFDEEAVIVDYKMGKGKYSGLLGGFVCRPLINMDTYHVIDYKEEHEFTISGMDDLIRNNYKNTHPIGTLISYTHNGGTDGGKPRFGRYIRKRDDITLKDHIDISSNKKKRIIKIFEDIYDYEKTNGEIFKLKSYKNAIIGLNKLNNDNELTEKNIKSIKGIGDSLFKKINDIIKNGTCDLYEKIKDVEDPKKLFLGIHGIGHKTAKKLEEDGYKNIQDLRDVHNKKDILNNTQILGLKYYEDIKQKIPREEIEKHETILKNTLLEIDKNSHLTIAGSYRRNKSFSGDIDVLLKANDKSVYNKFIIELKKKEYLIEDLAYGHKKYNGISKINKEGVGRRIDIMYTKPSEYPFAILYFTGSDNFNKSMREQIKEQGLTINEYSLKNIETKKPVDHVFIEEEDIFNYLDMIYVEPCDRL
tara:strand:- start:109 stop:1986 length:1878 start_codon:yes stop_codon:yes gene_type:complete